MANEKTLNDLILQVQATNIRLEALADSGNKQETHLATLAKASKGDKLQDLEDRREASKHTVGSSASSASSSSADKLNDNKGSGLLMRSALLAGLVSMITGVFAALTSGLATVSYTHLTLPTNREV